MCEFKKGDKVLVWDIHESFAEEYKFYLHDPMLIYPYLVEDEEHFVVSYKNCKKAKPTINPNTKVFVWDHSTKNVGFPRYATGKFNERGEIETWASGADQWSNDGLVTHWGNYRLADKNGE